jgi:hypothetical protein
MIVVKEITIETTKSEKKESGERKVVIYKMEKKHKPENKLKTF